MHFLAFERSEVDFDGLSTQFGCILRMALNSCDAIPAGAIFSLLLNVLMLGPDCEVKVLAIVVVIFNDDMQCPDKVSIALENGDNEEFVIRNNHIEGAT